MIERRRVETQRALRAAYNELHGRVRLEERPRFYDWVLDRLGPAAAGARLLDIGCGRGGLLRAAAARGLRAAGIDLSDVAAGEARRAGARAVAVACGEALPFADGSFPLVAHLGNLEHFLDPRRGAREIARVLAPAGRAAVLLPNAYYSGDIWRVVRTGYGPDHHQPIDRFATAGEWRDLLEGEGLAVSATVPYNKFKWWKRLLPLNLAYHFLFLCTRK